MPAQPADQTQHKLPGLILGAIGVVYGDIGTSPLYALKECFHKSHGVPFNEASILGVLSLLFWSIFLVVSIKYVMFIMRADNRGEGGVLSLMALALRGSGNSARVRWLLTAIGIFGAAMFYGDGMITPAVSVLSAVEGLNFAMPGMAPYVVPITIAVLIGLFALQSHGTGIVGRLFGPVMVAWFLLLAIMGIGHIMAAPGILKALSPTFAYDFFWTNRWAAFLVLGSVFLVLTGAEALYADMGHFGLKPIRIAWFGLVMPALLLNYFGQGALLLVHPEALINPFYLMVPEWGRLPMVILATFATVIASQAVISGVFSLTSQAIQLGYCPRMSIRHTSDREIGQIYVPFINWTLLLMIIFLVLSFRTSENLAAAYGIAVTTTMVATTSLAFIVMRRVWRWNAILTGFGIGLFMVIDLAFFGSNALKIADGGWFPLVIGGIVFLLLTTWKAGRKILFDRLQEDSMALDLFIQSIGRHPPHVAEGTAVFMTGGKTGVPHALLHNLKHNKVLHERNVLLTVLTEDVPYIAMDKRAHIVDLGYGFFQVEAQYGFKEEPDVPKLLAHLGTHHQMPFEMMETSFFLTRETIIASKVPGMAIWREVLFVWMSRNAIKATAFFKIPTNRVVELGTQVEI